MSFSAGLNPFLLSIILKPMPKNGICFKICGQRGIRTPEGVSRLVYSQIQLTALVSTQDAVYRIQYLVYCMEILNTKY